MKFRTRFESLLLPFTISLMLTTGIAAAAPLPVTLERVDPDAPCFRWPAVDYDEDGAYDRIDYCPNTPKGCGVDRWGCSIDADGDGVCDPMDHCPNTPRGEKVDKQGCSASQVAVHSAPPAPAPAPPVAAPPAPRPAPPAPKSAVESKLVESGMVRLENIEFETSSAKLLPESERSLNEPGEALAKYPGLKIEIGGHSDTRGAANFNLKLSQSRAESVRRYLLGHFTLRAENLVAKGCGESRPLTKERTPAELKEDRRVERTVLNPEGLPGSVKVVTD